VGQVEDLVDSYRRFTGWTERVVEGARTWAASERGQSVLSALDFFSVSKKVGDYFAFVGWYLPIHPALHEYAMERVVYHLPFDERVAADLVGPGSAYWEWIVGGVRSSAALESRRPVVEDALFCMEHGRWHAAVTTLLPVVEGVVSDSAGVLHGSVGRRYQALLHSDAADLDLTAIAAIPALKVLRAEVFATRPFEGVAVDERALNRHLILHGRTVAYGTRANACRVLMITVALVELLDGPLLARVAGAPIGGGSYLDDFGPLAGIRRAATRRSRAVGSGDDV
jgi:hypothetical protein